MSAKKSSVFQRGDSDRDKVGRFVAGSSATMMATVVSGMLSFVWTVLMQRLLGPGGYGLAKPFIDVFWILSTAVSFGVPQAMAAFISRDHQLAPAEAELVMAEGKMLHFTLGVIFLVAAVVCLAFFGGRMDSLTLRLGWLMVVAVMSRQMYFAMFGILGGVQRLDILAVCNLAFPATMLISSTLLVAFVVKMRPESAGGDAGVLAGAAGVTIATSFQYLFSLAVIHRIGIKVKTIFAWRKCRPENMRKLLSFGWLAAVTMLGGTIMSFVPTPVVSNMAHAFHFFGATAEENALQAGYFSSGYTYAMAPMLIVGMIYALLPAISEAHRQNRKDLMQQYFDLSIKYAGIVIGFILTVYIAFSGQIVEFFSGPEFPADAVGTLTVILAFGMSMSMLIMLCANLLMGMDKPQIPAAALALVLVLEAALIAGAGRFAGSIYMVAAGFDAAMLCGLTMLLYYVRKAAGLKFKAAYFVAPGVAAVVSALAVGALPSNGPVFLLWMLVAAPVYFFLLGLVGGFSPNDMEMLRNTLRSTPLRLIDPLVGVMERILRLSPLFVRAGQGGNE